jgi:outer membrane protein
MVRIINRVTAPAMAMLVAVAAAGSLLLAPAEAVAQAAAGPKIGFVNVARLLVESPQANAANKALENEFAPRQRDLIAKQNALKDRADKFQKDAAVMGADERRNAENDLRKDERELARQAEELRDDLNIRRNEAFGKLRVDLLAEVENFARQNGYDIILSDGVLYVSQPMDVTAQVLQALQARFGQGGGQRR